MTNLKKQNENLGSGLIQKNADTLVIETILDKYEPAKAYGNNAEIEYLSTMEIVEQFSGITSLNKEFIADELAAAGFSLAQMGEEYKWMLKPINNTDE